MTGHPPDIVSMALNLWDAKYWGDRTPEQFQGLHIPDAQMEVWLQKADLVFAALKVCIYCLA